MPVSVTCASCKSRFNVAEQHAGKRVKCPRCAQAVAVPATGVAAAAGKPAGAATASAPARPAAARTPAVPGPALLTIACAGCAKQVKVKAELAGKAVKCPGCGKPIKVVAPAPAEDGWIDVGEAVETTPLTAGSALGDWGQSHLEKVEVPQKMQEQIRAELGKNEKLVWADRPRLDVLLHRAKQARLGGLVMLLVGFGLPIVCFFAVQHGLNNDEQRVPAFGIAGLLAFFALAFLAGGFFMVGMPGRVARNAATRACYAISNRRFLLHPGVGMQLSMQRAGATVGVDLNAMSHGGVRSFTAMELSRMVRVEEKRFPGCGELMLTCDLLDRPSGPTIEAIGNIREVEKRLRATLIHPVVDKLLSGAMSLKDHVGARKESSNQEESEILPAEDNLKDYVNQLPTDPANVKQLESAVEQALSQGDAEDRARVEVELAEGEKLLWMGVPEGRGKDRGFFGALAGAIARNEARYQLYAITNRRVMLFTEKEAGVGGPAAKDGYRGPVCYYPPHLLDAGTENDTRWKEAGHIVFKRVKVITDARQQNGSIRRTERLHYFGILRIRNMKAVARLLFDTLIRPCKTS